MGLIIPHVNSEFSALIFNRKVTLSSQITELSPLRLLRLRSRELQEWNGPSVTDLIRRDTAFVPARPRSAAIAFLLFQLGKLRQMGSNLFLQVWIPESGCSFPQVGLPRRVLCGAPLAAGEMLSAPARRVCESGRSARQSSPASSFKFLFKKQRCAQVAVSIRAEIAAFL